MHDCVYLFEGKCPRILGRLGVSSICNTFCPRYVSINTDDGIKLVDKIKKGGK